MADKKDIEETPQDSTVALATSGMRVTVGTDAPLPEDRFISLTDLKTAFLEYGYSAIFSDIQLTGGIGTQGKITWNADEETLDLVQDGAVLQIGQELQVHCRNNTGVQIDNGTPVMATGTIGNSGRITIAPMVSTVQANAKYFIGITTEDIVNDTDGKITAFGKVRGINTTGTPYGQTWNDADVIYLDASVNGGLTNVKPTTGMSMPIAFIIHAHNNGTMMVRAFQQDENLYAEAGSTPTNDDIIAMAVAL